MKQLTICVAAALTFAFQAGAEESATPLLTALTKTTIGGYVDVGAHWNPGHPAFSGQKGATINGYTAVIPSWRPANSTPLLIRNYHAPVRSYGGLSGPTPGYLPIRNYGNGPSLRPMTGGGGYFPLVPVAPRIREMFRPPLEATPPPPMSPGGGTRADYIDTLPPGIPVVTEVIPGLDHQVSGVGNFQAVPEPATWALLAFGGVAAAFMRRYKGDSFRK